jgi:hypothetical protein
MFSTSRLALIQKFQLSISPDQWIDDGRVDPCTDLPLVDAVLLTLRTYFTGLKTLHLDIICGGDLNCKPDSYEAEGARRAKGALKAVVVQLDAMAKQMRFGKGFDTGLMGRKRGIFTLGLDSGHYGLLRDLTGRPPEEDIYRINSSRLGCFWKKVLPDKPDDGDRLGYMVWKHTPYK